MESARGCHRRRENHRYESSIPRAMSHRQFSSLQTAKVFFVDALSLGTLVTTTIAEGVKMAAVGLHSLKRQFEMMRTLRLGIVKHLARNR